MTTWPAVTLGLQPYNGGISAPGATTPAVSRRRGGGGVWAAARFSAAGATGSQPRSLVRSCGRSNPFPLPPTSPRPHPWCAQNFVPYVATPASASFVPYLASTGTAAAAQAAGALPYGPADNATFQAIPLAALQGAWPAANYTAPSSCNGMDWGASFLPAGVVNSFVNGAFYDQATTAAFSQYLLGSKNGTTPPAMQGQPGVGAGFAQYGASRYGALMVNALENGGSGGAVDFLAYTALVNTTGTEAAPQFVNLVHSGLYNALSGGVGNGITTVNAPLPFTKVQRAIVSSITSFVAVLFIVIAFSFIPSSFAVFIVKETEVKAKHQQLISGVSIP
jgi:hypothetical protein